MSDQLLSLLISDFQARPLPNLVPRDLRVPMLPGKATALVGMRRVGKTYAMYDIMRRLLAEGVPKTSLLYLNLEDERLGAPTTGTLDRALELFYQQAATARERRSYVFLDEIQVVPDWERFVRRVLTSEDVQVVLGGYSAKLLSTEIASSLRGYALTVEVLPYGLRETMRSQGIEPGIAPWPPGAQGRRRAAAALESYLQIGGFPEVQATHAFDRVQILQGYVETAILRDVLERHGVANLPALRHLAHALFDANAHEFSVGGIHGALVSQGIKVAKHTLLDYLGHLTDAYLVFLVSIRTRSAKQRMVNPRKVYAIDPGLAAAMYGGGAVNLGAQLECFVYLELRRRLGVLTDGAVAYYRTKGGFQVDFAVDPVTSEEPMELIQACTSIEASSTRDRETRALGEAMEETGCRTATIVTLNDRESIELPTGTVRAVPAWEWALERSAPRPAPDLSDDRA